MLGLIANILGRGSGQAVDIGREDHVAVATAVLLLDIALADSEFHQLEKSAVVAGLETIFGKTEAETEILVEKALKEREQSFDLYQFAKEINDFFEIGEKKLILENIWRVVYADGKLDKYEEALVRKIAKLMRLSHREMIDAKLKVLDDLGLRKPASQA